MKRALALCALIALSAPAIHAAPPAEGPPLVGGWSEVPAARLQAEVGAVARFAVSKLPRPHGKLKRIVGAERQVVAGMNYRMILILSDNSRWRVQVWKKLDGTMELSRYKREK